MIYQESDVIITLGAGFDRNSGISPLGRTRVDTAIDLFRNGIAPRLIMCGGWSFVTKQPEATEAATMKAYALAQDIPDSAIVIEDASHDTIGSAVFAKQRYLEPNGWDEITLVTSESHLERSLRVFRHVLGREYDVEGSAAPENGNLKRTIWESFGNLMSTYIMDGTLAGDDETIGQRLVERVPGYGGNVTRRQFAVQGFKSFAQHPARVLLPRS